MNKLLDRINNTRSNFYIEEFSPRETKRTFKKRDQAKRESMRYYFDDDWFEIDSMGRMMVKERERRL